MDEIVFSAQVGKWVCIKKGKMEPGSGGMEVSRILASVHESMDRKIWEFLKDDFPLEALDKIAYEITDAEYNEKKKTWMLKGRVSEAQISQALAKLNSPGTTKRINEVIQKTKNGPEIAKSYLSRKVIDLLGIRIELDPAVVEKYIKEKAQL
jgi:predicted nucleotidyltransferase